MLTQVSYFGSVELKSMSPFCILPRSLTAEQPISVVVEDVTSGAESFWFDSRASQIGQSVANSATFFELDCPCV